MASRISTVEQRDKESAQAAERPASHSSSPAETAAALTLPLGSVPPAPGAASVRVEIPGPLRSYCGGAGEIRLRAATVRALLEELERRYPSLHRGVCDE